MPKNAKKSVYREKEFEMYVLWKSLPAYFRGMKKSELDSHGFTDPLVMKVATIQSQTAFAKKFRIKDLGTLTDWNAKIKKNKLDKNNSYTSFKKEAHAVNDVLNTLPDTLLKKELYEQRKIIATLKKENKLLISQLSTISTTTSKKPVKAAITTAPAQASSSEPVQAIQPVIIPTEPEVVESVSFFKKALSFFRNKKLK